MIGKCRKIDDEKEYAGSALMHLRKASNTINRELLVAKLRAYGLPTKSICAHGKNYKMET